MTTRTKAAPNAKLTPDQVLEIRRLKGEATYKVIAARFGIDASLVCQIMQRDIWRWLKEPAKALALLIVAAAAGAQPMPTCEMPIQKAISQYAPTPPRTDCGYQLDYLITFQKVKDGYLLMTNPEYGPDVSRDLVFLKTSRTLELHQRLSGNAAYVAPVTYQALDGFERTVPGFMAVPAGDRPSVPEVEPAVTKLIGGAR
jgi:hypothetical protein